MNATDAILEGIAQAQTLGVIDRKRRGHHRQAPSVIMGRTSREARHEHP